MLVDFKFYFARIISRFHFWIFIKFLFTGGYCRKSVPFFLLSVIRFKHCRLIFFLFFSPLWAYSLWLSNQKHFDFNWIFLRLFPWSFSFFGQDRRPMMYTIFGTLCLNSKRQKLWTKGPRIFCDLVRTHFLVRFVQFHF